MVFFFIRSSRKKKRRILNHRSIRHHSILFTCFVVFFTFLFSFGIISVVASPDQDIEYLPESNKFLDDNEKPPPYIQADGGGGQYLINGKQVLDESGTYEDTSLHLFVKRISTQLWNTSTDPSLLNSIPLDDIEILWVRSPYGYYGLYTNPNDDWGRMQLITSPYSFKDTNHDPLNGLFIMQHICHGENDYSRWLTKRDMYAQDGTHIDTRNFMYVTAINHTHWRFGYNTTDIRWDDSLDTPQNLFSYNISVTIAYNNKFAKIQIDSKFNRDIDSIGYEFVMACNPQYKNTEYGADYVYVTDNKIAKRYYLKDGPQDCTEDISNFIKVADVYDKSKHDDTNGFLRHRFDFRDFDRQGYTQQSLFRIDDMQLGGSNTKHSAVRVKGCKTLNLDAGTWITFDPLITTTNIELNKTERTHFDWATALTQLTDDSNAITSFDDGLIQRFETNVVSEGWDGAFYRYQTNPGTITRTVSSQTHSDPADWGGVHTDTTADNGYLETEGTFFTESQTTVSHHTSDKLEQEVYLEEGEVITGIRLHTYLVPNNTTDTRSVSLLDGRGGTELFSGSITISSDQWADVDSGQFPYTVASTATYILEVRSRPASLGLEIGYADGDQYPTGSFWKNNALYDGDLAFSIITKTETGYYTDNGINGGSSPYWVELTWSELGSYGEVRVRARTDEDGNFAAGASGWTNNATDVDEDGTGSLDLTTLPNYQYIQYQVLFEGKAASKQVDDITVYWADKTTVHSRSIDLNWDLISAKITINIDSALGNLACSEAGTITYDAPTKTWTLSNINEVDTNLDFTILNHDTNSYTLTFTEFWVQRSSSETFLDQTSQYLDTGCGIVRLYDGENTLDDDSYSFINKTFTIGSGSRNNLWIAFALNSTDVDDLFYIRLTFKTSTGVVLGHVEYYLTTDAVSDDDGNDIDRVKLVTTPSADTWYHFADDVAQQLTDTGGAVLSSGQINTIDTVNVQIYAESDETAMQGNDVFLIDDLVFLMDDNGEELLRFDTQSDARPSFRNVVGQIGLYVRDGDGQSGQSALQEQHLSIDYDESNILYLTFDFDSKTAFGLRFDDGASQRWIYFNYDEYDNTVIANDTNTLYLNSGIPDDGSQYTLNVTYAIEVAQSECSGWAGFDPIRIDDIWFGEDFEASGGDDSFLVENFTIFDASHTEPPVIILNSPSENSEISVGNTIYLSIIDASGVNNAEYNWNGGSWTPFSSPFDILITQGMYDSLSDGSNTLNIRATDSLGETGQDAFTFQVDKGGGNGGNGGSGGDGGTSDGGGGGDGGGTSSKTFTVTPGANLDDLELEAGTTGTITINVTGSGFVSNCSVTLSIGDAIFEATETNNSYVINYDLIDHSPGNYTAKLTVEKTGFSTYTKLFDVLVSPMTTVTAMRVYAVRTTVFVQENWLLSTTWFILAMAFVSIILIVYVRPLNSDYLFDLYIFDRNNMAIYKQNFTPIETLLDPELPKESVDARKAKEELKEQAITGITGLLKELTAEETQNIDLKTLRISMDGKDAKVAVWTKQASSILKPFVNYKVDRFLRKLRQKFEEYYYVDLKLSKPGVSEYLNIPSVFLESFKLTSSPELYSLYIEYAEYLETAKCPVLASDSYYKALGICVEEQMKNEIDNCYFRLMKSLGNIRGMLGILRWIPFLSPTSLFTPHNFVKLHILFKATSLFRNIRKRKELKYIRSRWIAENSRRTATDLIQPEVVASVKSKNYSKALAQMDQAISLLEYAKKLYTKIKMSKESEIVSSVLSTFTDKRDELVKMSEGLGNIVNS